MREIRQISREGDYETLEDGKIVRYTRQWREMGGQYDLSVPATWCAEHITPERSIAFGPGASRRRDGTWFRRR